MYHSDMTGAGGSPKDDHFGMIRVVIMVVISCLLPDFSVVQLVDRLTLPAVEFAVDVALGC